MEALAGLVVILVVAVYALFSSRAADFAVSGPMVFVAAGTALGPLGLGMISTERDVEAVRALFEAALVLALFADAAAVGAGELRRGGFLPLRLVALGLPLCMAAGALTAWPLLPGLGVWELALVGTLLVPTDTSLIRRALGDVRVPPLIRQGINTESGLNDGPAVAFFLVFLSAAGEGAHGTPGLGEAFTRALLWSIACGAVLGRLGGLGLVGALRRGWTGPEWLQIFPAAVALASFAAAHALHGSGFIAAWVAGLAYATTVRRGRTRRTRSGGGEAAGEARAPGGSGAGSPADTAFTGFTDQLGSLLTVLAFFAFGAVLLGPALLNLTWQIAVYAVLSLTVVRMLPVALCLLGSGLAWPTVAYLGWFGPRGLASVVLALLVVQEHIPGGGEVSAVVAVTVGLSVVAHGLSAGYLAGWYGRWYAAAAARDPALRECGQPPRDGARREPHPRKVMRPPGRTWRK